jgi:hypothetical protein
MRTTRWAVAVAVTLATSGVSAVGAQERAGAAEEEETKNEIGIFVGALSNLDTDETGPGVGFDYTRELSETFGFGGLAEWANAGDREAMFAASFEWKPGARVKLVFAPGVVVGKEADGSRSSSFAFRTGVGRELEVHHVPLTPTIYFDFVNAEEGVDIHLVYGLTIGIPF